MCVRERVRDIERVGGWSLSLSHSLFQANVEALEHDGEAKRQAHNQESEQVRFYLSWD